MSYGRALGTSLTSLPPDFELLAYRGAIVFSRNGWIADVKARGGVVTQVPGGFFHGIMAGRFGGAPPYTYELPPVWLLVDDGIEAGTYELLDVLNYSGIAASAENQRRDVANLGTGAAAVINAAPAALKWAGIGALALLGVNLLQMARRSSG